MTDWTLRARFWAKKFRSSGKGGGDLLLEVLDLLGFQGKEENGDVLEAGFFVGKAELEKLVQNIVKEEGQGNPAAVFAGQEGSVLIHGVSGHQGKGLALHAFLHGHAHVVQGLPVGAHEDGAEVGFLQVAVLLEVLVLDADAFQVDLLETLADEVVFVQAGRAGGFGVGDALEQAI